MPYVDNRGVRIGYRTYGEGEPLVLIHGWSCEGRYWNEFGYVSKLSDRYQVVVPDLRGHGDSDTPNDRNFSDAAFASDVVVVLDELGLESAHIFGYSLGGWVAFELAANSPSRVRSVVAGGAHPYAEDLSALRGFPPAEIVRTWESVGAPLSEASKKRLADMDPQLLIEMAPDRIDLAARLKDMQMRGLLVCGTEDWRFEDMRRFAQANAYYEFVSVQGLDHLQTWLRADQVVLRVLEFLGKSHE